MANAYWPVATALDWMGLHVPKTSWVAPFGIALATAVSFGADQAPLKPRTLKAGGYGYTATPAVQKLVGFGLMTLIGIW